VPFSHRILPNKKAFANRGTVFNGRHDECKAGCTDRNQNLYLDGMSTFLMKLYLQSAIQALAFFPGMNLESDRKVLVFKYVTRALQRHFELVPMSEFSKSVSATNQ
jgi:hypothetical protein